MVIKLPKTKTHGSLKPDPKLDIAEHFHLRKIPGYDPFKNSEDYYFDADDAQRSIDFFPRYLTHIKGKLAGKPLVLEDWQIAIISNLFGWKNKSNHTRRYREAFIYLPRKNGKTVLAAGIALYMMFCDREPGAEIYCAAAERDQAGLVFDHAKGMVHGHEALRTRSTVYTKAITLNESNTFFKVISADAHTKHGYSASCLIIDELHAQPNRELVDVLTTSTAIRTQPLTIYITTADYERESICNEKLDFAGKVRDGVVSANEFLPVIYEALITEDWKSPQIWEKANPIYNISEELQTYLAKEFKKACEIATYENTFKRLHLNMKTQQDVRWISMDRWKECGLIEGKPRSLNMENLQGAVCYGGLDLANTQDIAAYVLYFPDNDCSLLPFFFVPEETAKIRDRSGRVPYLTWARQKYITLTPGNVIDYDYIREVIIDTQKNYHVQEIAYDRWGACQLVTQLEGEGFKMEPFGQGFASMTTPCREFEKLIASGVLNHGNNPVLTWMVGNAAAAMDPAGNVKPAKDKSSDKIDGVVAAVMGIAGAIKNMASVYDTRGVLQV